MENIPNFGDLVERRTLDGDKVHINDILNKKIVVTGYSVAASKYEDKNKTNKDCVKVQFYFADDETEEHKVFFSGSDVIKKQCCEAEESLKEKGMPFLFNTSLKKVGNYYSFT